jgi:hypothetical protein
MKRTGVFFCPLEIKHFLEGDAFNNLWYSLVLRMETGQYIFKILTCETKDSPSLL